MTLGGSQLLGEEAKECRTVKLGERVVRSYHVRHTILGNPERTGKSWTESERHCHSRRRGHSVASKHVGLRGLWLQEALVDGKPELEKVDTATNPADVCAKVLPGDRTRELCRLACVYVCCSEEMTSDDPPMSGT